MTGPISGTGTAITAPTAAADAVSLANSDCNAALPSFPAIQKSVLIFNPGLMSNF